MGTGYDVHAFAAAGETRPLVLGGVTFPDGRPLAGHSDADVIVHALCDALLGAMGAGDMGRHFPDSDPRLRGASSFDFLAAVAAMMAERGWRLVNADLTVLAEEPRVGPRAEEMQARMARPLGVPADAINVKATRPEKLGALGRREGIACQASVLIARADVPDQSS